MVEIKNLVKKYGNKTAVNDISFSIEKGEIVGFLGSNGAGKSTTMNVISGYISATSGSVKINGYDILKNPIKAKAQIGYLPEQPPLYVDMTVKGYLSFVYDLKKVKLNKMEHIKEVCERVGILDVWQRPIKKLSKGYKQRVGIAQALIGYPPLIILDEPTVGLDPRQIISIRNLIKELAKDHTTIFSSHILYEVQTICDRIIVIDSGRLIADKSTDEIIGGDLSADKNIVAHIEGEEEKIVEILKEIDSVKDVKITKNLGANLSEYVIECKGSKDIRKDVFGALASNDLSLTKLDMLDRNLEEVFLNLIDKQEQEDEEIFEKYIDDKEETLEDDMEEIFDMEYSEFDSEETSESEKD